MAAGAARAVRGGCGGRVGFLGTPSCFLDTLSIILATRVCFLDTLSILLETRVCFLDTLGCFLDTHM